MWFLVGPYYNNVCAKDSLYNRTYVFKSSPSAALTVCKKYVSTTYFSSSSSGFSILTSSADLFMPS